MPNAKFQIGDTVRLKSSSPLMTVDRIYLVSPTNSFEGYYRCVWFVGDTLKSSDFHEDMLEPDTPSLGIL